MMGKQLTSKIALGFVLQVEALNEQIEAVYTQVREFEGQNNDSVIRDVVRARAEMRERAGDASAMIGSFDWDDEGERIHPRDEDAWPSIAADVRAAVGADKKILKTLDQIDRLHSLAVARGLPQISKSELDAARAMEGAE